MAANCPQEHVDALASNHPNIPVHRLQMVNRELGSACAKPFRNQLHLHNRRGPVRADVLRSQPLKRLVDVLHAWEGMGDAVLRALESEGIVLDTSVDAAAPAGFSFLGECKSIPGVSRKSLYVWHAPHTHLPLTMQDAERLIINSSGRSRSLLASERPVPSAVRELLQGNGYEVWDREEIIRILGKAQLSLEESANERGDGDEDDTIPHSSQTPY